MSNETQRQTRRVSVVNPLFRYDGASTVAVSTVSALVSDYDVEVITFSDIDARALRRFFGEELAVDRLAVTHPWRLKVRFGGGFRFHLPIGLIYHATMRFCKKHRRDSLLLSTADEMDFGEAGIQYIHFPSLRRVDATAIASRTALDLEVHLPRVKRRRLYRAVCRALSGYSEATMKLNRTLVNSDWTGRVVKELYGIEADTVYPPVRDTFPEVAWEDKEMGFVCLGRLSRDKNIETAIRIVAEVRRRGLEAHLHIVGPFTDEAYAVELRQLPEVQEGDWVSFEGRVDRRAMQMLLASHKYGIHAMPTEHFGISIAEMILAGCIPFVPAGGGQVEIVEDHDNLLYASEEDAVAKIVRALDSPALQDRIRARLDSRKGRFSEERFQCAIRSAVNAVMLG